MIELSDKEIALVNQASAETHRLFQLSVAKETDTLRGDIREIKHAINGNPELGTPGVRQELKEIKEEITTYKSEIDIQLQLMRKRMSGITRKQNILATVLTFFTLGIGWLANMLYTWVYDKLTHQNQIPPTVTH